MSSEQWFVAVSVRGQPAFVDSSWTARLRGQFVDSQRSFVDIRSVVAHGLTMAAYSGNSRQLKRKLLGSVLSVQFSPLTDWVVRDT